MGFPLLVSRKVLVVACIAFILGSNDQPAWAAVCHNGIWENGEFCGRDAYLVTGTAEMNHDCVVDMLDLSLFAQEWQLTEPNLSGDLNADGIVASFDFLVFASTYGGSASACTVGGMLSDSCEGTIALSFDSNPATIVSTQAQAPGQHRVYTVVDGWTNAEIIEYAVEASSNVSIVDHPASSYPHWLQADIQFSCDPDAQRSYRGFVSVTGSWPAGPIAYSYIDYLLLDTNPAWIKLVPVPACHSNSRIRWATTAANRSYDFAAVLNVGINGPAPPGEPTCSEAVPIPAVSEWGLITFGTLLLCAMAVALRRQRAGQSSLT